MDLKDLIKNRVEFTSLKKSGLESIYKYSRFDDKEYYKDLLNNVLYFPDITQLNDPFDSQTPIRYDLCSDDELNKIIVRSIPHYNPGNYNDQLKRIFAKNDFHIDPQKMYDRLTYFITRRVGIFSMAERKDNLLLWAHYTQNHTGFCLEFDAQRLYDLLMGVFFKQNVKAFIYKVIYHKDYPILIPSVHNSEERLQKQFLIKSKEWEYEQEWRILVLDGIRKNEIPAGIIKNIYFGLNVKQDNIETCAEILKISNPGIGLYKAVKKKDAFGLDFKEIRI